MKTQKITNNSFGKIAPPENPYDGRLGLVYPRVSSKRQELEGHGRESQEERCRQHLKFINVPYEKTFPDTFTGAGDFMKRPAMRQLFDYIDANPHKKFVVVFDDIKRLARDVAEHFKLKLAFKMRDVILQCPNYNFDESEEGEFVELIFAGQAQLERKQNRRQVIQKMKARLEAGYYCFASKTAYRVTKDPLHGKLFVADGIRSVALQEALEGFSTGLFVRKIDACKFLLEKKFWKGKNPDKYIDDFTDLAKDCFYAGFIEYLPWGVEIRVGKHQGIISWDTYQLNQKRLNRESLNKKVRLDLSADFPLRGLLICDHCSSGHLSGAWSSGRTKKYPYYFCQNENCIYYKKSISRDIVETQFTKLIRSNRLKVDVEGLVKVMFDRVWNNEMNRIQKSETLKYQEKGRLDEKIKQLTEVMLKARSEILKQSYESQIEAAAQEIKKIEEENTEKIDWSVPYRTALDKAIILLKNPYFIWKQLSLEQQHKLFYFIFEQKLPYNKVEGYRTDKIKTILRLFEEFSDENSHDVDSRRIELLSPQCECDVLPLYYKPLISNGVKMPCTATVL